MHYHPGFIPTIARYLLAMRAGSHPRQWAMHAAAMDPITKLAVPEHRAMGEAAGARGYFRETGMFRLYRSEAGFLAGKAERDFADLYGAGYDVLDANMATELEPNLKPVFFRAVHWTDAESVSSPGKVTRAYADLFARQGGKILKGDALTLGRDGDRWHVQTDAGALGAPIVVAAIGRLVGRSSQAARLPRALCRCSGLPPPLSADRQRQLEPPGPRFGQRLCHHTDGAGDTPDDGL